MNLSRRSLLAILLLLIPAFSGCGGDPMGSIKGTVTLDDKPLPTGTLTFETPGRRPATAKIKDGQIIEVTTFKLNDGLPVGTHKVAVSANEAPMSAVNVNPGDHNKASFNPNYMSGKSLIPPRYNNPETSGLTVVIKSGENTVELKLASK